MGKEEGLMFPKKKREKRRKNHPPSILPGQKGICLLCVKLYGDYTEKYTEVHHVFFWIRQEGCE